MYSQPHGQRLSYAFFSQRYAGVRPKSSSCWSLWHQQWHWSTTQKICNGPFICLFGETTEYRLSTTRDMMRAWIATLTDNRIQEAFFTKDATMSWRTINSSFRRIFGPRNDLSDLVKTLAKKTEADWVYCKKRKKAKNEDGRGEKVKGPSNPQNSRRKPGTVQTKLGSELPTFFSAKKFIEDVPKSKLQYLAVLYPCTVPDICNLGDPIGPRQFGLFVILAVCIRHFVGVRNQADAERDGTG